MAAQSRKSEPSVKELLLNEPYRFGFFQAVRLLALLVSQSRKGEAGMELEDVVRFKSHVGFDFAPSDVREIAWEESVSGSEPADRARGSRGRPLMTVNFMGLAGHDGPLPDHYSELILERVRRKDFVLRDFLDIFNHRIIQLFYEAWERPRFYVSFERGERDPLSAAVRSLVGVAADGIRDLLPFGAELPVFYSGCLARRPASTNAAEVILASFFDPVPIELVQFEGRWLALEADSRFVLGDSGSGAELGGLCPLGERVWDVQGQVRMRVGPLTYEQFLEFGPGGEKAEALQQLFRFLSGAELDVVTELLLAPGEAGGWRLGGDGAAHCRLGQSMWLGRRVVPQPDSITFEQTSAAPAGDNRTPTLEEMTRP